MSAYVFIVNSSVDRNQDFNFNSESPHSSPYEKVGPVMSSLLG